MGLPPDALGVLACFSFGALREVDVSGSAGVGDGDISSSKTRGKHVLVLASLHGACSPAQPVTLCLCVLFPFEMWCAIFGQERKLLHE